MKPLSKNQMQHIAGAVQERDPYAGLREVWEDIKKSAAAFFSN